MVLELMARNGGIVLNGLLCTLRARRPVIDPETGGSDDRIDRVPHVWQRAARGRSIL
jgi:hypothetical protein